MTIRICECRDGFNGHSLDTTQPSSRWESDFHLLGPNTHKYHVYRARQNEIHTPHDWCLQTQVNQSIQVMLTLLSPQHMRREIEFALLGVCAPSWLHLPLCFTLFFAQKVRIEKLEAITSTHTHPNWFISCSIEYIKTPSPWQANTVWNHKQTHTHTRFLVKVSQSYWWWM